MGFQIYGFGVHKAHAVFLVQIRQVDPVNLPWSSNIVNNGQSLPNIYGYPHVSMHNYVNATVSMDHHFKPCDVFSNFNLTDKPFTICKELDFLNQNDG